MAERWQPAAPAIDATTFETLIAAEPFVVIHFWAEWDTYDRHLNRDLGPIRAEFAGRVAFRSVDVDRPDLAPVCRACDVANVPALAFFAHGRRLRTLVGLRPAEELRQLVASLVVGQRESTALAVPRPNRTAAAAAILLWLTLNAVVAVPYLLDPLAIRRIWPLYLGGVLLVLEPLFLFWACYQYRYLLRPPTKPHREVGRDA